MFDSPQNNQFSQQKNQKKNSLRSLVLILGFFAIASLGIITLALLQKWNVPASAAPGIYKALSYQGKLEDIGGIPVADGLYNIIFTIYDADSGGNILWTARESDACGAPFNPAAKSVTIANGVFSTMLGESGDCPLDLNFNNDSYYLGITVGADSEMTPRKRIGAAGYAFNADLLDGLDTSLVGGASSFVPATDASGNFVLTGNVTFDTNTFLLDATNDSIGIGTSPIPMAKVFIDTDKTIALISQTSAASGRAISANASATSGTTFAGSFSAGPVPMLMMPGMNVGVFASGSSDTQNGYGGYFMGDNYGVFATESEASGYGVYGASSGGSGRGVFGEATSSTGTTYGVYGQATGTLAANYGGYFSAAGPGGSGVYGTATDTSSTPSYGGYFTSAGGGTNYLSASAAVYGKATNTGNVTNLGGYFESAGANDNATGVLGYASDNGAFNNTGGVFISVGQSGRGVYGLGYNTGPYSLTGVKGEAYSTGSGTTGVYGVVAGAGNNLYGVHGEANQSGVYTNYGGYFKAQGTGTGTSGVYGEASGSANSVYGVQGLASATGAYTNYGGYFKARGETGYGVYGEADSNTPSINYGGYFTAAGTTGRGVYGEASAAGAVIGVQGYASSLTAGVTNYGGYFTAQGGTAQAVFGDATNFGAEANYGGYFTARGSGVGASGIYAEASGAGLVYGVYGIASDGTAVANYGGYFVSNGTGGARGVYGSSPGASGTNYGVYGDVTSSAGWGGYFTGGNGLYASRFSIADATSGVSYNTIGTAATSQGLGANIDLFIAGKIEVDGAAYFDGGHTDLAEMVAYSGGGEDGDVIVIDDQNDNSAKLATKPYDKTVIGVISTNPSLTITGGITEGKLLAIAGRVPTRVSNINGAIHRGDLLTTSSVPGHAMKAIEAGPIVGKAMGECDQRECVIWVFLNISWYGGN